MSMATFARASEIALSDPTAETIAEGHVAEAMAKTPLAPPSALR